MDEISEYSLPEIHIPLVGEKIRTYVTVKAAELDRNIGQKGFSAAVSEALTERGINYSVEYGNKETEQVLRTQPVLLAGSHSDFLGTWSVLSQLPNRDDLYLFANSDFLPIGENFRRHTLPVYGVTNQETSNLRSKIWKKYGYGSKNVSALDAAKKNVQSLVAGAERLKEGSLVVMWPDGNQGKDAEWLSGIGDLVLRTGNPELQIVYFNGITDYKALVKSKISGNRPSGLVRYSKPYSASEFLKSSNRKDVAVSMQNEYRNWLSNLGANLII